MTIKDSALDLGSVRLGRRVRTKLIVNNEDFNGLPQKTQEVLGLLNLVENAVVISGDVHATLTSYSPR